MWRDTVDDSLFLWAETDDFQHMYAFPAAPIQSPGKHGHKQLVLAVERLEIDQPQSVESNFAVIPPQKNRVRS